MRFPFRILDFHFVCLTLLRGGFDDPKQVEFENFAAQKNFHQAPPWVSLLFKPPYDVSDRLWTLSHSRKSLSHGPIATPIRCHLSSLWNFCFEKFHIIIKRVQFRFETQPRYFIDKCDNWLPWDLVSKNPHCHDFSLYAFLSSSCCDHRHWCRERFHTENTDHHGRTP